MKLIKLKENFGIEINNKLLNIKPFNLIWVESGEHIMGIPPHQERAFYLNKTISHFETCITKGYWIGQFPITQGHWLSIKNNKEYKIDYFDYPLHSVSWLEAMIFCRELNTKFKAIIPGGYHFSLPTELHWEYACCAGEEPINEIMGDTPNLIQYYFGKTQKPYAVGKSLANNWGLYDMLGNVSEWCFDITEEYPNNSDVDWTGKEGLEFDMEYDSDGSIIGTGRYRSIRGSERLTSCREYADYKAGSPSNPDLALGFRVCLRPITEWDLNDPILKKYNINMIG